MLNIFFAGRSDVVVAGEVLPADLRIELKRDSDQPFAKLHVEASPPVACFTFPLLPFEIAAP